MTDHRMSRAARRTARVLGAATLAAMLPAAGLIAQTTQTTYPGPGATAELKGVDGAPMGTVTFTQTEAGVLIDADLSGVPEGVHGFHIHETGACTPDFAAAGGHFVGDGDAHGFRADDDPHAGDMPNIHVPASGELHVEILNDRISLEEAGLLQDDDGPLFDGDGSALMIHSGADDYYTQPSGDAGDRIACAVIEPTANLQ